MPKNIYVLDTNVLIDDPSGVFDAFKDGLIVLSVQTLEELDRLKQRHRSVGTSARKVSIGIEILQEQDAITIDTQVYDASLLGLRQDVDNLILLTALRFQKEHPQDTVILVTNDRLLRCKGRAFGLKVRERRAEQPEKVMPSTSKGRKPTNKAKTCYSKKKKRHGKSKRKINTQKKRNKRRTKNK